MTRADILPQILKLSEGDQLLIVEAIHDHLAAKGSPDENDLKAELLQLQAEADADPDSMTPLAEVMRRLESRR